MQRDDMGALLEEEGLHIGAELESRYVQIPQEEEPSSQPFFTAC